MDLGSALVGSVMLAMLTAPFVIMHYNTIKKEKKKLQSLKEIAQQHNCNISQYEICGDFALGIDENRKFVFFLKQKKEETITQFFDLLDVKTCQAIKKTRPVKTNKERILITERVELGFILRNKSKGETRFELYDEDLNIQLSGELLFVEKWSTKINDLLKNN